MNAPTSDGEVNTEELMRHRSTTRSQDKDKRGKQRLDESNSRYFNYINPWAGMITVNVHEPHGTIIKLVTVFMAIHELELYTSRGYTRLLRRVKCTCMKILLSRAAARIS